MTNTKLKKKSTNNYNPDNHSKMKHIILPSKSITATMEKMSKLDIKFIDANSKTASNKVNIKRDSNNKKIVAGIYKI